MIQLSLKMILYQRLRASRVLRPSDNPTFPDGELLVELPRGPSASTRARTCSVGLFRNGIARRGRRWECVMSWELECKHQARINHLFARSTFQCCGRGEPLNTRVHHHASVDMTAKHRSRIRCYHGRRYQRPSNQHPSNLQ